MSRSQRLCAVILADLPDDQLEALLREIDWHDGEKLSTDSHSDRMDLSAVFVENEAVLKQLMNAWRARHSELCELMCDLPTASTLDRCLVCGEQFGAADVLLEMLTDPHDDGWELARWTVGQLPPSAIRVEMEQLLSNWEADGERDSEFNPRRRIVVFGGHPRDENKFHDHQFEAANVTLIWNTFEKSGRTPDERTIDRSMQTADAVVVVTKLVSHNIMHMVKKAANRLELPFRCIEKATATQLERVIREIVEQPDPDVGAS